MINKEDVVVLCIYYTKKTVDKEVKVGEEEAINKDRDYK